ncbi:Rv0340 family IniB-related protein [Mycolicibacterium parafortuitum]|uniref:Uncharacterized protein n=1 Tax=Mycolicibacterium parafortuitum TaxID=39692 RepID=A0A375YF43_MYCPF|nr:IniB N-terminal domain-containing protein [Mycolicibacterium parafortuitum]ORB31503.1 hypothetical protein BST38_05865 [Mycolicibacterium parafortuitum]SRX79731.1 hypothetical protein MPP7335_01469 [Mycolicibacterium parafortuitum]
MANSLLDFVMTLVRDPEAAARYAADPARALAEADLTDVTSADVQNLIPVVAESLSTTVSSPGLDPFAAEPVDNVWASGAATAAFDAFDDLVPTSVGAGPDSDLPVIVDEIDTGLEVTAADDLVEPVASLQLDDPVFDASPPADPVVVDDWTGPDSGQDGLDPASGFDLFD